MDNHETRHPASLSRFIGRVNETLADGAPPYVVIHDVDSLAAWRAAASGATSGSSTTPRCPAPPSTRRYGFSVASLLAAQLGLSKKCLVLDLDNTLWGGVIGDDGLGGIRLGQGDAEGEAFLAFQHYAKALKERGVLLAVCSKNEEHIAKEVFEKHTEMVLAAGRHLLLHGQLERQGGQPPRDRPAAEYRRQFAGASSTTTRPSGPSCGSWRPKWPCPSCPRTRPATSRPSSSTVISRRFASARRTLQRAEYYRANAEREQALERLGRTSKSICNRWQMVARIGPINAISLERSAQLINKSNQFNLTTRRRSAAEVLALVGRSGWLTRTVSLRRPLRRQRPDQRAAGQGRRRRPGDRHLADELPRAEARRRDAR